MRRARCASSTTTTAERSALCFRRIESPRVPVRCFLAEFLIPLGITQVALADTPRDLAPADQRDHSRHEGRFARDGLALLSGLRHHPGVLGSISQANHDSGEESPGACRSAGAKGGIA